MPEVEHQPKNITISTRGNEICQQLASTGLFENDLHAYRVAIFVALASEAPDTLDEDATMKSFQNKWDTDAVFRTKGNSVESSLIALGIDPNQTIVKGKRLGEIGLRILASKLERHIDILDDLVPRLTFDD